VDDPWARQKAKCYLLREVSQRPTQLVWDYLHPCTDTNSTIIGHGKKSGCKTSQELPLLVSGVGHDLKLASVEEIVYRLYGTPQQPTINHGRMQRFHMAKKDPEMVPPARDAMGIHAIYANYQAKRWLQTNQKHLEVPPPVVTKPWKEDAGSLTPISYACVELVTCSCTSKCPIFLHQEEHAVHRSMWV